VYIIADLAIPVNQNIVGFLRHFSAVLCGFFATFFSKIYYKTLLGICISICMEIKNWFIPTYKGMIAYLMFLHVVFLHFIINGEMWQWAVCFLIYYIKSVVGGTVTLHRLLTHRSFKAPKWFEYLGTLLAIPGTTVPVLYWVAIHRTHHRYSDTEKDPHSPLIFGYVPVQFRLTPTMPRLEYVPDILKSKFHMNMLEYHWLYTILVGVVIYFIDPYAVVYAYLAPSLILQHASSMVNTLTHSRLGYRNFETRDQSVNNFFVGYFHGGEGWHNNHHANASDPQFGKKWWEFDPGYHLIQLVRTDKT